MKRLLFSALLAGSLLLPLGGIQAAEPQEYIMCSGDVVKTADRLFCHKNTVRYRLAKIQEMVDPKSNDKAFYESLSIAIRIYMLTKFNRW